MIKLFALSCVGLVCVLGIFNYAITGRPSVAAESTVIDSTVPYATRNDPMGKKPFLVLPMDPEKRLATVLENCRISFLKYETFRAACVRTRVAPMFSTTVVDSGLVTYSAEFGAMLFFPTGTDAESSLSRRTKDAEEFWMFNHVAKLVTISSIPLTKPKPRSEKDSQGNPSDPPRDSSLSQTQAPLLFGIPQADALQARYRITLASEDAQTVTLKIVPKLTKDLEDFVSLEVRLLKSIWKPDLIECVEASKNTMKVSISNYELNPIIDADELVPKIPPGWTVKRVTVVSSNP